MAPNMEERRKEEAETPRTHGEMGSGCTRRETSPKRGLKGHRPELGSRVYLALLHVLRGFAFLVLFL